MPKLVSIHMTTFNRFEIIKRTIPNFIRSLNYPNYEFIIIDDCSDDVRVHEYLIKLSKEGIIDHLIINKKRMGLGFCMSKAFESSKGEYLLHLDNDMIYYCDSEKDWLYEEIKLLDNKNYIGTVANSKLYGENNEPDITYTVGQFILEKYNYSFELSGPGKYNLFKLHTTRHSLISKRVWNKIKPIKGNYRSAEIEYSRKLNGLGLFCADIITDRFSAIHIGTKYVEKLVEKRSYSLLDDLIMAYENGFKLKLNPTYYPNGFTNNFNSIYELSLKKEYDQINRTLKKIKYLETFVDNDSSKSIIEN